ncbi:MAG: hypothetical protein IIT39_03965, partial [Clostridia bacterium]|nr:hypothetical protein [Clostridia bacterium]
SLIFGLIGLAFLTIAGVSFMANSTEVAKAIISFFHGNTKDVSNSIIAELGVVFMIPSFIFAYKSFTDTEYDFEKLQKMSVSETQTIEQQPEATTQEAN